MANKSVLEQEVERWKGLSLALLLLLGIVGGLSYTLIIQQKAIIEDKDIHITRLLEKLRAPADQEMTAEK